jgi:hypothetical protein
MPLSTPAMPPPDLLALLALLSLLAFAAAMSFTPLANGTQRGLDIGFGEGVALQPVNIKAWTNALPVSAGWVMVAELLWPRLMVALPLRMAFGFASNLACALIGLGLRRWLAQGRRLLSFNPLLALVLLGTAAWMTPL